ncbi:YqaJ viral recombinase family protein [Corynebacterium hindlerae]|uniref:YqaJ viral recombinase family protein n=1 Tax=Corynebacterium hindlerae TaxID=699041 RepID=A0A7G5FIA1_9CORY|nr:YqaJ viral recombinase family protein [Corynebacterium hindlerae]QMV86342.1 YqaJ viral recombinase family protein [Corynebacterium hindlerae]
MDVITPPIKAVPLEPFPDGSIEWQQQRQSGIGSSDASVIMGMSNFESPYSLWEIKTGRAPLNPPRDQRQEELLRWGHLLEPVIREETSTRLGVSIIKPDTAFQHHERAWQRCNLDGWSTDGRICEFKNTSFFMRKEWVGQIPDHAEIQVHHSAAVIDGVERAIVAGLISGNELSIFEITINRNVVDMIIEQEARFWECVTSDTPPPIDGHDRTYQALTRELTNGKGWNEVGGKEARALVETYWSAHEREKAAKADKNTARNKLAAMFDGHEAIATGETVWAKTTRGQLNMTNLAAEHPELVERYTRRLPTFDLDAFKAEQPEAYRQFQTIKITPQKLKETH